MRVEFYQIPDPEWFKIVCTVVLWIVGILTVLVLLVAFLDFIHEHTGWPKWMD